MTHAMAVAMRPPFPAERGVDVYNKKLGMWVFLASEVMFFAAVIGCAMFVGIQIFEYFHLVERGFTPAGVREGSELAELVAKGTLPAATMGLYGSTFFTMTGFHGFHVTCGVVSMAYLYFVKALPGKYSKQDYGGIETVGLYWHFVDLVWIILFTIVYLI